MTKKPTHTDLMEKLNIIEEKLDDHNAIATVMLRRIQKKQIDNYLDNFTFFGIGIAITTVFIYMYYGELFFLFFTLVGLSCPVISYIIKKQINKKYPD